MQTRQCLPPGSLRGIHWRDPIDVDMLRPSTMDDRLPVLPPESDRKSVVRLKRAWYVVHTSADVTGKHIATATLWGTPLVLWRNRAGVVQCVVDRCPHRNVPLRIGSIHDDGTLACKYHGWRFGDGGVCAAIPGLPDNHGLALDVEGRCATAHAVREQDGFVWVWGDSATAPDVEPFALPQLALPRAKHIHQRATVRCTMHGMLENILDVPHTAFLHGGLFRTPEKKNEIDVEVDRRRDGVTATFLGEPRPPGLIGKLLSPSGGVVEHWDRFYLPCVAQVEYRLGLENQIITTNMVTPVDDTHIELFTVVTIKVRLPVGPLYLIGKPIADRIFEQDREILEAQTDLVDRFGVEKFSSTPIDLLGPHMLHLLKKAELGKLDEAIVRTERTRMRV
jgi:phenylpropionate dioxygenase-like ring-hydroxylating dioxygenase large terminal subunit